MNYIKNEFNLDWFLSAFEEIFPDKNELIEIKMNDIENIKNKNNFDYKKFIDEVFELLHLPIDKKQKFLEYEETCIDCEINYPYILEPFIEIIKIKNLIENKNITKKICFDCIEMIMNSKCSNCDYKFQEPYEKIYIYQDPNVVDLLKNRKIFICEKCIKNDEIPLLGLFYKDIELKIEFNLLKEN